MKIKKISAIILSLTIFIVINLFIFNFRAGHYNIDIKQTQIITPFKMKQENIEYSSYSVNVKNSKTSTSTTTQKQPVTFEDSKFVELGFNKTEEQYFYIKKEILDKFEIEVWYNQKREQLIQNSTEYIYKRINLNDNEKISIKVKPRDGYIWASKENIPQNAPTQFITKQYSANWGPDKSLMDVRSFYSRPISRVLIFAISLIMIVAASGIMMLFIIFK